MRLAKVKFGLNKNESAIAQLNMIEPGSHKTSYEELRGDIYYAMGLIDESREAYQRAVNLQPENKKPITQMKLDDLVAPRTELAIDEIENENSDIENAEEADEDS